MRRTAREHALMILYQIDVSNVPVETALERFFASFSDGRPLDPPLPYEISEHEEDEVVPSECDHSETREFASMLVRGVRHHLESLDDEIGKASSHWRIERMARVDRNILRVGAFELLFLAAQVPRNVVLNEAVEIAKGFGTLESGAFINGVLDKIRK